MMLAFIHHIVIGYNVPFSHLAKYLHDISKWLLIEYVPKEDPQVKQLLTLRDNIFADYQEKNFEKAFGKWFKLVHRKPLRDSKRIMYLMEARQV